MRFSTLSITLSEVIIFITNWHTVYWHCNNRSQKNEGKCHADYCIVKHQNSFYQVIKIYSLFTPLHSTKKTVNKLRSNYFLNEMRHSVDIPESGRELRSPHSIIGMLEQSIFPAPGLKLIWLFSTKFFSSDMSMRLCTSLTSQNSGSHITWAVAISTGCFTCSGAGNPTMQCKIVKFNKKLQKLTLATTMTSLLAKPSLVYTPTAFNIDMGCAENGIRGIGSAVLRWIWWLVVGKRCYCLEG